MPYPYTAPVLADSDLTKFPTGELENVLAQTRGTFEHAQAMLPDAVESVTNIRLTIEHYGQFQARLEQEVVRRLEAAKG